ncbi:MAG: hypothetical protein Q8R36_00590 [bacterium]|nr:hypothetical protein [bacterium]
MKKTFLLFFVSILFLPIFTDAVVYVNGYYRSNGTYVAPHVRSDPNGLKYDNYGYKPSDGLYNKTYGTRGAQWDTPTYITDPNYYQGKNIYDSGNNAYFASPSYSGYSPSYPTTPTTPICPANSYYDGISSCKCNYGYAVSGGSCVSANSLCYTQLGYSSSYDSLSNSCKCDSGYVIGTSGQCVSGNSWCYAKIGIMSQYNQSTKTCECISGYQFDGSSCVYKTTSPSNYSTYSASAYSASSSCPLNSHPSPTDSTKCACDSGYQPNSTKTSCVATTYSSYASPTYTPPAPTAETIGKNYYLTNRTCIGLSGNQFEACISYAWNH